MRWSPAHCVNDGVPGNLALRRRRTGKPCFPLLSWSPAALAAERQCAQSNQLRRVPGNDALLWEGVFDALPLRNERLSWGRARFPGTGFTIESQVQGHFQDQPQYGRTKETQLRGSNPATATPLFFSRMVLSTVTTAQSSRVVARSGNKEVGGVPGNLARPQPASSPSAQRTLPRACSSWGTQLLHLVRADCEVSSQPQLCHSGRAHFVISCAITFLVLTFLAKCACRVPRSHNFRSRLTWVSFCSWSHA